MNVWDQLRRDEGFRPYPYLCTGGALTIGYGRNIARDKGGPGLAEVEAAFMLRNDVAACEIRVCGTGRGVANCGHCAEYVCGKLDRFFSLGFDPQARTRLDEVRRSLHGAERET